MNKKIFILLFFLFVLISMSAVSAVDADDNNDTIVSSADAEALAIENDVNAMDELNEDDTGSDDVLQSDAKSAAAGEKEILSVGDSDSDVLGAKESKITIDEAYSEKIGSDYKIIVTGSVKDVNDDDIGKGTVSIYLNDESKGSCTAEFGWFSGEVVVGPGSYNVGVRYHDDSGDYDDSQDNYYDNIIIKPPEPTTWYVNGSKPYGNGGKSEEDAFSTLNEALYAANNNDTVKIAAGTYTGSANIGPYIQKILTFEKYGDGEAIFDGQGQGTIWSVGVDTINIYGLTFINGGGNYGGALYFIRDVSNSVINATFRDNSVSICGGAIYVDNSVSNLTLRSTFINNTANEYGAAVYIKSTASNLILNSTFINNTAGNKGAAVYIGEAADNVKVYGEYIKNTASQGGVIYANKAFSSSVIDATFINNTAKNLGGAFCFNGDLTGVDISGKFLNNTGGDSIIYVANSVSGNSIHDSVFLNNEAYKIITVYNGEITAKDNWFGSDASNYYKIPEDVGIDLENWLFLNATADPSELDADEKSTIIFKLSSFDGSEISDYDASKMNVVLELSQTLGQLNKNTTLIGEDVIYTAKQEGNASVTGKVGTAYYTINLKNNNAGPANASVSVNNATLDLFVDDTFTIVANTTPSGLNVTYIPDNSGVVSVDENGTVTALKEGTGNITVKVGGDGVYAENTTTVTVTVSKIATEIIIQNVTVDMKVNEIFDPVVSIMPSGAGELDFTSSDVSVVTVNGIGTITAVGDGVANVTVRFMGNDKYAAAESKNITVIVGLNDASVSVNNSTLDLFVDDTFTIIANTTPSGLNVTYIPDNSGVVSVDENGTVTALKEGTGNITVKVGGDGVYAENSTTVTVTVSKKSVKIDLTEDGYAVYVDDIYDNLAVLQDVDGNNITDEYRLDYTSSDESVVKIVDDSFVAVGEGLATITVSFNGTDKYESADDASFKVGVFKKESSIDIEPKSVEIVAGEDAPITVILPEDATGIVLVDVGDNKYYGDVENGNATVNIAGLTAGDYTAEITYVGDDKYGEAKTTAAVKVDAQPAPKTESSIAIVEVNGYNITGILSDDSGKGIADAQIKYAVNGTQKTVMTAKDGSFVIEAMPNSPVSIDYAGDNSTKPAKTSITLKEYVAPVPVKVASRFNITNNAITIYGYAVDVKAGEHGILYSTELLDADGKPISNAFVQFAVNNKIYNRTTYENGSIDPYHLDMVRAGRYTMAFSFGGDDNYTSTFAVVCVDLDKKPITIKASSKTYKASTKTKKYTVQLKTIVGSSLDGKAHLRSGLVVKLKVNGKTYTGKTNSKGQVTFKITNLKKKANYKARISYAGDKTYESASKTVTLKVK